MSDDDFKMKWERELDQAESRIWIKTIIAAFVLVALLLVLAVMMFAS